jgi:hypothetical protein
VTDRPGSAVHAEPSAETDRADLTIGFGAGLLGWRPHHPVTDEEPFLLAVLLGLV